MFTAFDLEATFILKGCTRRAHARILEWGMVKEVNGKRKTYHALVNPFSTPFTIENMKNTDPVKTMRFWVKVLSRQGIINTAVKRKSLDEQIKIVSDLAVEGKFKTPKEALEGALEFGEGTWVAHNCKCFDQKIVEGEVDRIGGKLPKFADSLPMLRRELDLKSYSQEKVYKHLFKGVYAAHLALDDAKALFKILKKVGGTDVMGLFANDLRKIKGVGKKSEAIFIDNNIKTQKDLRQWVKLHTKEEFLKTFSRVHRHKKLADDLFGCAVKLTT